jgi:UDP-glucose 4-epimerase
MIVVTGGSGFIGTAVVKVIERRGMRAFPFDRSGGLDILDANRVDEWLSQADGVIHLAGVLGTAELFDRITTAVDVNIHGSRIILEAAARYQIPYVGITMPQVFPSIYTATKIAATRLASALHGARGLPVAHVRAFNAYGPGQAFGLDANTAAAVGWPAAVNGHPQKIVPAMAACSWSGRPMPIWGDGTQGVDLVHVDDVARMLVDALTHGDDDTFDAGTGAPFTVNDVAAMIGQVTGNTEVMHLPMRHGEAPTRICATGEGWDRLGWSPEFNRDLFDAAVAAYAP